jgi:hypothetical protein
MTVAMATLVAAAMSAPAAKNSAQVMNAAGATRWKFAGSPRPLPRSPLSNQWKLKLSEISIQANASTPNATASGTACLSLSTIG